MRVRIGQGHAWLEDARGRWDDSTNRRGTIAAAGLGDMSWQLYFTLSLPVRMRLARAGTFALPELATS